MPSFLSSSARTQFFFRVATTLILSLLVDKYFSALHQCWVVIIGVGLVLLAARFNLRIAIRWFLSVVIVLMLGNKFLQITDSNGLVSGALFLGCVFSLHLLSVSTAARSVLIMGVVALGLLFLHGGQDFSHLLSDACLGGMVGFICGLFLWPRQLSLDFSENVLPVIGAFQMYLSAVLALLFSNDKEEDLAQQSKIALERLLQSEHASYPEWVYEAGFNPALQQGHRHFLFQVERVAQILFAMHYLARQHVDSLLLDDVKPYLNACKQEVERLLEALCLGLQQHHYAGPTSNLDELITELSNALEARIALPLELLDVSADGLVLRAMLYYFKDLRQAIAKLGEALRI